MLCQAGTNLSEALEPLKFSTDGVAAHHPSTSFRMHSAECCTNLKPMRIPPAPHVGCLEQLCGTNLLPVSLCPACSGPDIVPVVVLTSLCQAPPLGSLSTKADRQISSRSVPCALPLLPPAPREIYYFLSYYMLPQSLKVISTHIWWWVARRKSQ